jgi:hypothetical protein
MDMKHSSKERMSAKSRGEHFLSNTGLLNQRSSRKVAPDLPIPLKSKLVGNEKEAEFLDAPNKPGQLMTVSIQPRSTKNRFYDSRYGSTVSDANKKLAVQEDGNPEHGSSTTNNRSSTGYGNDEGDHSRQWNAQGNQSTNAKPQIAGLTREMQRQISMQRRQNHITELQRRRSNGTRLPMVRMSQERPMSEWSTVMANLTRPHHGISTEDKISTETVIGNKRADGFTEREPGLDANSKKHNPTPQVVEAAVSTSPPVPFGSPPNATTTKAELSNEEANDRITGCPCCVKDTDTPFADYIFAPEESDDQLLVDQNLFRCPAQGCRRVYQRRDAALDHAQRTYNPDKLATTTSVPCEPDICTPIIIQAESSTENTRSYWDDAGSSLLDPRSANIYYDTSDTTTNYSIESSPAESGNEYIHAFSQQLARDLVPSFGSTKLSTIPPTYLSEALRMFSWKLHEESRNPFQWEASVAFHQKRE